MKLKYVTMVILIAATMGCGNDNAESSATVEVKPMPLPKAENWSAPNRPEVLRFDDDTENGENQKLAR